MMLSTEIPKPRTKSRFADEATPTKSDHALVAPLLSRAHLLKTRGQWEEAVAVCTDAVRRSPDSPSPYALLGEIYDAQGKNEDALHWYRMALDRNPLQAGIAEKHDSIVAAKRASVIGSYIAASPDQTARFAPVASSQLTTQIPIAANHSTAERTMEWFDRVFPPGRSEGMTRLLWAAGGAISLLVLLSGAFLFFVLQKTEDSDEPLVLSREPAVTQPAAPGSLSAPAPIAATGALPTPILSLAERLKGADSDDFVVTAAQADAKTSQIQLEIALVFRPNDSAAVTRNRVLQACAKVAQAAFLAEPTAQRFAVRVLLQTRSQSGVADTASAALIFVGETSAIASRTLASTSSVPDYVLLSALFTNTWWSRGLQVTAQ